jgi:hypothetical protein
MKPNFRSLNAKIWLGVAVSFVSLLLTSTASAQWTASPSPSPNNNIYYNAGNVGIGTTSPAQLLHLNSAAANSSAIQLGIGGTTYGYYGLSGGTDLLVQGSALGDTVIRSSQNILFGKNSSTAPFVYINSSGNVGIGTATPPTKLSLQPAAYNSAVDGIEFTSSDNTTHSIIQPIKIASGAMNLYLGSNSYIDTAGSFARFNTSAANASMNIRSSDGTIRFNTNATGGVVSERMQIDNAGNVGIGTATPGSKLDVAGNINATGTINAVGGLNINGSPVTGSVFGRTGAVTAGTNDYTFAQVNKTTSSLADLTTRSASDLSSGTLPDARFPATLPSSSGVNLTSLNASSLTSGTLPDARFPATLPSASGTNLTSLNASSLANGTVATGRLGSGTADPSTFLRGDNTWAVPSGGSQWTTGSSNSINYSPSGNVGVGTAVPTSKLHVTGDGRFTGNLTVEGNIAAKYQDVAEWVPSSEQIPTGTVVVLDSTKSNHVVSSGRAYDTRVAGVISARPGIALGEGGNGKVLVATTGRVLVNVDATTSPIHIGDLLVTSDVPGMAMKSIPVNIGGIQLHRPGTLIGKALEPLEKGSGKILVLLSLQ